MLVVSEEAMCGEIKKKIVSMGGESRKGCAYNGAVAVCATTPGTIDG